MPHTERMVAGISTSEEEAALRAGRCPRCRGLMVLMSYDDQARVIPSHLSPAWRCVLCGEVLDPIIVANRRRSQSAVIPRSRARLPIGFSDGVDPIPRTTSEGQQRRRSSC